MRFVAVGDVLVDVVCDRIPSHGQRVHGSTHLRAGGSAVNAAVTAADRGANATVVGRIGSDPAGELVLAALRARGVEAELARDPELPTGVAVSFPEGGVVASRGANARFSREDVPSRLQADALFVSGFALFQEGSREAARTALERFEGDWSAVDLSSPRLAAGAELDVGANAVFATAAEAEAVTGLEPEAAARALARRFAVACVKLGAEGALAARGDELERVRATPVARTSPFGAGDAFAAVFLVGLAGGDDLAAALTRACEAGARAAGSG